MSKFDYLVGTENDFSGAACDCTLKIWHVFHGPMFCTESTIPRQKGVSIIAMRRIIQEPKRWTVEDQKAGRLPEVGSVIHFINDIKDVEFVGSTRNGKTWIYKYNDGSLLFAPSQCFTPLETPEEKAERLKDEWGARATELFMRSDNDAAFDFIYDALLSGELTMPGKVDE